MSFKHILVMTDFSEYSDRALSDAVFMAKASGCPLTILHVAHDKSQFQVYINENIYDDIKSKLDAEIEENFSKLESRIEGLADVTWESRVRRGEPYIEGLYEAEKGIYDLLVIGSHGESGIKRFAYGTTAGKILHYSPISLHITKI